MRRLVVIALVCAACTDTHAPIVVEIGDGMPQVRTFELDGERDVQIVPARAMMVEAWVDHAQWPDGTAWIVPQPFDGERTLTLEGSGDVTLTVWGRGDVPPAPTRARSATWFDGALLDDPSFVSFARVMAAVSDDGHGGMLLDRWFRAFAAGPGAGRATFAQFLAELRTAQGDDPHGWDLSRLPFRVTGVHDRIDLARGQDCGELRVSIASTHPTLAPLHMLFIFHQPIQPDDVTPDGAIHCRGTARRWAALAGLSAEQFATAARAWLDQAITRDHFALAESVELTLSPWQWRQWIPDGAGGLTNPPLFQTIDVDRVNAPGPTRDAFLAEVTAHESEMLARQWTVPPAFRSQVAEVQPTEQAALVDLSTVSASPELPHALGMIGCPRCHTENADFVQTSVDRVPSPFYDKELDARTQRIDALAQGRAVAPAPFGPLQPL